MNGPWSSLAAAWRQSPLLWPQAAAGVRDWQQALQHAAVSMPAIDAWPHEPDVALLLQPLAPSPLQAAAPSAMLASAASSGPRAAPAFRERAAGPAHQATGAAQRSAPPAPNSHSAAAEHGRRWLQVGGENGAAAAGPLRSAWLGPGLNGPADSTTGRAAGSGVVGRAASLAPGAAPARVAALLAQFSARQRPTSAAPAAAAGRAGATLASQGPAVPAYSNVVPLHGAAGVPPRPRGVAARNPSAGPATTLRRWSRMMGLHEADSPAVSGGAGGAGWAGTPGTAGAPDAPHPRRAFAASDVAALLALGERALFSAAAASPPLQAHSAARLGTATAALPPAAAASSPPGPSATTAASPWRGVGGRAALDAAPPAPAWAGDALAGLSASLERIENQLAAAAPTQAPAAPQWLTDDDTLAERIHDILRRQARRHGIDTP